MSAQGNAMSKSAGTKPGREGTTQATHRTSKSRADKSRGVAVAPVPPVTLEMVPGRLTEEQWLCLVNSEEPESSVCEVLDALQSRVMEECFHLHLAQQAIPYTISQARDAIIQITQWTFLPWDPGEENLETDQSWREQDQPQPCPHDSWAQGCVPRSRGLASSRTTATLPVPHSAEEQVTLEPSIPETPEEPSAESPKPSPTHSPCVNTIQIPPCDDQAQKTKDDNNTTKETSITQKPVVLLHPSPPPPGQGKFRRPYRPHRGPLHSASFRDITKSLEETEKEMFLKQVTEMNPGNTEDKGLLLPPALYNILKIQLGRPPQKKDVLYDEAGNVLSMPKLDAARLPQHHVHPQVTVLASFSDSDSKVRKRLKDTTSRRMRQGRGAAVDKGKLDLTPMGAVCTASTSDQLSGQLAKAYAPSDSTSPEGPRSSFPFTDSIPLDTIQLSHGVILREGNNTRKGSLHSLMLRERGQAEDTETLRPIQGSVTQPRVSVDQLIRNYAPVVRPIANITSR
uniref:Uncharacterized protein n=1 Tax=Leptobrachium leishanense TaxID=445787 RepID=A0A8C5QQ39_9ANUR